MSRSATGGTVLEFPITVRTPQGMQFYHAPIGSIVYKDVNGQEVTPTHASLAEHLAHEHGVSGMTESSVGQLHSLHVSIEHGVFQHRLETNGHLTHVTSFTKGKIGNASARDWNAAASAPPFTDVEKSKFTQPVSMRKGY